MYYRSITILVVVMILSNIMPAACALVSAAVCWWCMPYFVLLVHKKPRMFPTKACRTLPCVFCCDCLPFPLQAATAYLLLTVTVQNCILHMR
jgi:hypothetical protein